MVEDGWILKAQNKELPLISSIENKTLKSGNNGQVGLLNRTEQETRDRDESGRHTFTGLSLRSVFLKLKGSSGRRERVRGGSILICHDDNCQRAVCCSWNKSGTEEQRERVLWLEARLTFGCCEGDQTTGLDLSSPLGSLYCHLWCFRSAHCF